LENILEHALIICREAVIRPEHLPDYVRIGQPGTAVAHSLPAAAPPHDPEHLKILAALKKTGGHRGNTARELGMERTTLWRKMKKYNIRG
jgi:transcriptional regulator of acetoin/glycerol metabolism